MIRGKEVTFCRNLTCRNAVGVVFSARQEKSEACRYRNAPGAAEAWGGNGLERTTIGGPALG